MMKSKRVTIAGIQKEFPMIAIQKARHSPRGGYDIIARPGYCFEGFNHDLTSTHTRYAIRMEYVRVELRDLDRCTCGHCRTQIVRTTLSEGALPAYFPADHPFLLVDTKAEA
jgi:hypothetical protein